MVIDYLTKGGIPDGWSVANLRWLAQAHRRHAQTKHDDNRACWHARWATLIEDLLESRHGPRH